jgi:hypothetical protein
MIVKVERMNIRQENDQETKGMLENQKGKGS